MRGAKSPGFLFTAFAGLAAFIDPGTAVDPDLPRSCSSITQEYALVLRTVEESVLPLAGALGASRAWGSRSTSPSESRMAADSR